MWLWFLIVFLRQHAGGDYSGPLSETVILCGSTGSHYVPAISSKSFSWAGGWFFPWSLFRSRSGVPSLFYLCLFSCTSWLILFFEDNFITSWRCCSSSTWGHSCFYVSFLLHEFFPVLLSCSLLQTCNRDLHRRSSIEVVAGPGRCGSGSFSVERTWQLLPTGRWWRDRWCLIREQIADGASKKEVDVVEKMRSSNVIKMNNFRSKFEWKIIWWRDAGTLRMLQGLSGISFGEAFPNSN